MNICFITTWWLSKHASIKRSLGMAPVLASQGHRTTIALIEHPDNREWSRAHPDVECVFFPPGNVLAERRWKRRFLQSRSFDVVVYNSLCWRNAVAPARGGAQALSLMEHCELESANLNTPRRRRWSQAVLEWWSLWAFPGHICASRYLLDLTKRRAFFLGLKRTVFWSPYAVDEAVGTPTRPPGFEKPATKTIVHIGTVAKNYGCLFMLDGLRALAASRRDWRAVFIGSGRDLAEARRHATALGLDDLVSFPGFVPEETMRAELAGADVFLSHLNDTEQDWARCPSKVYYYMALGRPVVTPPIGENQAALGASGFYYRFDSPVDFARATAAALDAPASWRPGYDAASVSWTTRTAEFLRSLPAGVDRAESGSLS